MGLLSKLFGQTQPSDELDAMYRSAKPGVGLAYPAHWSIQAEDQLDGVNTFVVRIGIFQTDKPSTGLMVVVGVPTEKDDDIEGYLRSSKAQFRSVFPGFRAHAYERTTFKGHSAAWIEHSYDGSYGRARESILTVFVNQTYVSMPLQFIFETSNEDHRKLEATFKAILESVEIAPDGPKGNVEIRYV